MDERKIKLLRETINTIIVSEHYDKNKLLGISHELDKLILEAIKEKDILDKDKKDIK